MSIKIHHGAPGSFKTSGAVMDDFIPCVRQGRVVITNVRGLTLERVRQAKYPLTFHERWIKRMEEPYKPLFTDIPETFDVISFDTTKQSERDRLGCFFHWAPKGAFFLIDEAQSIFPDRWTTSDIKKMDYPGGRDAAALEDRPATWDDAWDMHRHYGWDITLTTPNIKKIRTDIREASEGAYKHRNLGMLGINGRYNEGFHDAQENGLVSQFITLSSKKISKEVWCLYDSTTTGTFTDTLAGVKLWKDPKILGLVAIAAGSIIYSLNHLPAFMVGKPSVSSPLPKPPFPSQAVPLPVGVPLQGADPTHVSNIVGNVANIPVSGIRDQPKVDNYVDPLDNPDESPWAVVGFYRVDGRLYLTIRRNGVTRTIVDRKGVLIDGSIVNFDLDGKFVATWTGRNTNSGSVIGGKP